jgi:hypothetical protein
MTQKKTEPETTKNLLKLTTNQAAILSHLKTSIENQAGSTTYQDVAARTRFSRSYCEKLINRFSNLCLITKQRVYRGVNLTMTPLLHGLEQLLDSVRTNCIQDTQMYRLRAMTVEDFLKDPEITRIDWKGRKPSPSLLHYWMREFKLTKEQLFLYFCKFGYDLVENGKESTIKQPLNYLFGIIKFNYYNRLSYEVKGYCSRPELLAALSRAYREKQTRELALLQAQYNQLSADNRHVPAFRTLLLNNDQRLALISRRFRISYSVLSRWAAKLRCAPDQMLDFLEFHLFKVPDAGLDSFESTLNRFGYYPCPEGFESLQARSIRAAIASLERRKQLQKLLLREQFNKLDPASAMYQKCLEIARKGAGWFLLNPLGQAAQHILFDIFLQLQGPLHGTGPPLDGS